VGIGNRQPELGKELSRRRGQRSAHISFHHIVLHHALGVEKRTVERNAVAHHVDEAVTVLVE